MLHQKDKTNLTRQLIRDFTWRS